MKLRDVLASEWLKLWSVRSTWYALALSLAGVVVPAALAWNVAGIWDARPAVRLHMWVTPLAPIGALFADLCLAVLGILTITSEYSTGMIRTSLAAVPRRGMLLAAKALVVAAVSLVVGEAIVFASSFATHWIIGSRPIRFLTTPLSQELPVLFCLGLGVMVFALVGLGLGCIFRSAPGAIVTLLVGFLYLVPVLALHLPEPWSSWISSLMIQNLAGELSGAPRLAAVNQAVLSPPWALAALAAYVVAALGSAAWLIVRREA